MISNTQILNSSSQHINDMKRITNEIERDALISIVDLKRQTEHIDHQIVNVDNIETNVRSARSIISRLSKRQVFFSILLLVIILILLSVIAIIIYFVLRPYFETKPK